MSKTSSCAIYSNHQYTQLIVCLGKQNLFYPSFTLSTLRERVLLNSVIYRENAELQLFLLFPDNRQFCHLVKTLLDYIQKPAFFFSFPTIFPIHSKTESIICDILHKFCHLQNLDKFNILSFCEY